MMDGSADAQRIGVELQNLLKIPPISRVSNATGANSGSGGILQQFRRLTVSEEQTGKPSSISVEKMKVVKTETRGAGDSARVENTPPNRTKISSQDSREGKNNGSTKTGGFDKPFKQSGGKDNKYNSSSHEDSSLISILRRPDCPRDLQLESEALVDYATKERMGEQISSSVKTLLSRHYVDLLSKRSPKFPKAKFFCSHCNYHMDTVYACVTHIMGIRHTTFELMKKLEFTLLHIPDPSPDHCISIGRFLMGILSEYGITDAEMERRKEYIKKLNQELKAANIDCTLSLYGSSFTSLGFKDSDINVHVTINNGTDTTSNCGSKSSATAAAESSDMLQKLFLFFQHHPGSTEVKKLVTSKSAKIHLRECENFCEVILSMNSNAGIETAKLFTEYVKLNPLVRLLTMGLRVWAKYCEIDNQDKGCLPPHSYAIMVIHYLQRKDLLPNLHLMHESRNANLNEGDRRSFASAEEAPSYWNNYTTASLGYHWLKMLRFYAVEFNYKESVISISHQNVLRAEKYWNRKISVEDPAIPKLNLSKSMSNNRMCDYILERLKFTYLYFGIPRTIRGPLYDGIVAADNASCCRLHVYHKVLRGTGSSSRPQNNVEKLTNSKWDPVGLTEEIKRVKFGGNVEFPGLQLASVKFRVHQYIDNDHKERIGIHVDDVAGIDDIFPEWLYDYKFDTQALQNGLKPPIVCKSCGVEGHFRSDCPDEVLPVLRPVMNATPSSLRLLNDVLMQNFEKETLNSYDVEIRAKIVAELESALLPIYPDAQLTMFGSTHNGFGVHMSDVDVCLTFRNKSALKVLKSYSRREIVCRCQSCQDDFLEEAAGDDETNALVILRTIVDRLKSAGFLQEVVAIPSAKVPIVKFRHRATSLEGDISLYNTLAMYNTKLLRTYAELDWRVKVIGCFLKKLTKLCDISDASRGSLSSYGYVLMAIHYFQHTPIPVLPVLQELCRDTLEPIIVDGCDVQYFRDLQNLKYVWPYYGKNRQSLAELWLGFLNYYTETFNFEEHVVTISQYNTLTRVYKFWLTDALAIEDPFDRTHNLGAGLSRRMSIHILKTFHHLRQVFHSTHDASVLRKSKDWLTYFTDPKLLQNGNPPLDRQCRICHKIGHIARNCTQNNEKNDESNGPSAAKSHTPTLREVVEKISGDTPERPKSQSVSAADKIKSNSPSLAEVVPTPQQQPAQSRTRETRSNSLSQQDPSFPRFFGENSIPNAEDEAIFRMITGESARENPGVEFVLQEQPPGPASSINAEQIAYGNHIDAMTVNHIAGGIYPGSPIVPQAYSFNGLPINFAGDPSGRLRASYDPQIGGGVTFMGPPSFQPMAFMGNPNINMGPPAAPPPPGFAPLPNVPIVSHPTYIHPHVIPSHPFPVNLYPIPVHRAPAPPQHDGGGHPGPHHLHPFPAVFTTNVGPRYNMHPQQQQQQPPQQQQYTRADTMSNGEAAGQQNHGSPIVMNGCANDPDRVCLPTMTSLSPIMTSYPFPPQAAHMAQYPRVNDN